MKFAVCLLVVTCGGALASDQGQTATTASAGPPAPAQANAASQVRPAEDSDLAVKEWPSPISFDVDASWLRALPSAKPIELRDIPAFYCNNVSLDHVRIAQRLLTGYRLKSKPGVVKEYVEFQVHARQQKDDKVVVLEFTLLSGENRLLLGRLEDLELDAGESKWANITFELPTETIVEYTAVGLSPRLRVSMKVLDN